MTTADDKTDLDAQIALMSASISRTLTEVATIRHPMMDDDRVLAAVDELDAIVAATEIATDQILEATERLDAVRGPLKAGTIDAEALDAALGAATTEIYEASNFQDITGQRIAKVMALLRDIDLRVMAMIQHLGGEPALATVPPPEQAEGDAALVNGPQEAEHALQQNAIDSLFD